jgi:hypothetical protein
MGIELNVRKIVGSKIYSYRKLEKITGCGALQFFPSYLLFKSCVQSHAIVFCYTSICKSKISHCTSHLSNSETSNHDIAYIVLHASLQFLKSPLYPGALLQHLTCSVCGTIVTKSEFLQKACKVKVYFLGTTMK